MGGFDRKSGRFVGETILGYKKRDGISITNLGSVECEAMHYAMFIPPASPATIHTIDALTVNGTMQLCSSYYSNAITESTVKKHLDSFIVSREYGPPLSWRHTPPQEPAGTDK